MRQIDILKIAERAGRPRNVLEAHESQSTYNSGPASLVVHAPQGLATRMMLPNGDVSLERVADMLSLSKTQLAETLGLRPETVFKAAREAAPKTQSRIREMLEILTRVSAWAGGEIQAFAWYRAEPLPAFGGQTAEGLVKAGLATPLRDYLDHIATGGFA